MNLRKIDEKLFRVAKLSKEDEKVECLLSANDFYKLKKELEKNHLQILDEYLFINSFYVSATKKQLEVLSKLSSVRYIWSNASALALMNVSRKVLNFKNFCLTGRGVGVAFIDTGIHIHPDFCMGKNRIKKFVDFVDGKTSAYDDNGHGTFVSGVCSGGGTLSGGKYMGFAPQSQIYALKALDKNGEAYSSKILSAMKWVYENHKAENIKVVCMSFGSDPLGYNDPIMNGAEQLWKSGVIVVAAAGNNGPEFQSIKSPGVSRKIITVGGMDDNRLSDDYFSPELFEVASFSSRGPSFRSFKPDVIAPAVEITSCGVEKPYIKLSGTSVATPMIAGIMCLLKEKYPDISPDEAKRKLISCCRSITFNKNLEGYGYPDLTKLFN